MSWREPRARPSNRLALARTRAAALDLLRGVGEPPRALRARILSRGVGRLVAEFAPLGAGAAASRQKVVGKFYARDTGYKAFQVMRSLRAALRSAGNARVLAIPEPYCYDHSWRCLLQQRVEAEPLRDFLGRGESFDSLYAVGLALATLHACRTDLNDPKWLTDHLAELLRPSPAALAQALPTERARIGRLLDDMLSLEAFWREDIQLAPVHRDFHLGQLLYDRVRVWLVDWDHFAHADPALDVGNFLTVLELHFGGAYPGCDAFLQGYFALGDATIRRRIPLYQGLNFLRRACKCYRLRARGWQAQAHATLARAEAALAAAQPSATQTASSSPARIPAGGGND